jgi:hypothetical protein
VWSSSSTEVTFNRHALENVELPLCLIRCMESEGLGACWRLVMSFTLKPLWLLRKAPGTHWIGGCMGPRDGPDTLMKVKELLPTGNRTPSFSPNQSRYWLSYLAFCYGLCTSSCVVQETTWVLLTVSMQALCIISTSFVRISRVVCIL